MFKNKLKFNRKMALMYVGVIGLFGVGSVLYSSANSHVGSIKLTSYSYVNGALVPIGNVNVTVETVGGSQKCNNNKGTTNAAGDHSVTLSGCQVSGDGTAKMYRLIAADRPGYQFRSLHSNHGAGRPIEAGNSFKVVKGDTTSLQVWMNDLTPPPAPPAPVPAPAPAPAPAPQPSEPKKSGKVRIVTKRNDNGENIGDVTVRIKATGDDTGFRCHPSSEGKTGVPGSASHGEFTLPDCRVSDHTGVKEYQVVSALRPNWEMTSVRVGKTDAAPAADNKFQLKEHTKPDDTVTIYVFMRGTAGQTVPPPQPGGAGSTPTPAADPDDKNGSIRIISYDFNGGDRKRQGNVGVHVRSVNNQTTDVSRNCNDYNKTTDTQGNHDSNPNYGRAHFDKCWTSGDGSKYYELSLIRLPDGYNLESFRITSGGNFHRTTESVAKTIVGKHFLVEKNKETQLEIWLNKIPEPVQGFPANPPSGGGPAAVPDTQPPRTNQVLTQTGSTFVAAGNNRPISQQFAAQLNEIPKPIRNNNPAVSVLDLIQMAVDAGHTNPNFVAVLENNNPGDGSGNEFEVGSGDPGNLPCDDPDRLDMCTALPPSPPTDLKATQNDAGDVTVTWADSTAPSEAGSVFYDIYRKSGETRHLLESDIERGIPDPATGQLAPLEFLDDGTVTGLDDTEIGLAFGTEYVYEVVAKTGDDIDRAIGVSVAGTLSFTPVAPKINVSEDAFDEDDLPETYGEESLLDEDVDIIDIEYMPDEILEDDIDVYLYMPYDEEGGMSCTITKENAGADGSLASVGTATTDIYSPSCRDEEGNLMDDFGQDYELIIEFDEDEFDEDSDLYGYDGVGWEEISLDGDSSKGLVKYASAKKVKGKNDRKIRIRLATAQDLRIVLVKSGESRQLPLLVAMAIPLTIGAAVGALIISRRQQDSGGGRGFIKSGGVKIATPHGVMGNNIQPQAPNASYYQPTVIKPTVIKPTQEPEKDPYRDN